MTKDQSPSDKACDAYFDNPCAATSCSYYSDRVTFYAGFAAGAASRDAEIAELVAALELLSKYIAYNGDDWVQRTALEALAKVRKP